MIKLLWPVAIAVAALIVWYGAVSYWFIREIEEADI